MNDHFELQTQLPKPKDYGGGRLSIGIDGAADFIHGDQTKSMSQVRIVFAAAHGILLTGMQLTPGNRYILQQWWLRYIRPSADGVSA